MHKYQSTQNLSDVLDGRDMQRRRSSIDLTSPELVNLLAGSPPSAGSSAEGPANGGEAQIEQVNVPLPTSVDTAQIGENASPMEAQCADESYIADLVTDHAQCSSARRAALRTESICHLYLTRLYFRTKAYNGS